MLRRVVPDTAVVFARALVMPNTLPPVCTAGQVVEYRDEILRAVPPGVPFEPLLTFKVLPSVDPSSVGALVAAGTVAGKLYPAGVTTHSADGVRDPALLEPLFSEMERHNMVLCIHGEEPDAFVMDREALYLRRIEAIVTRHPGLRVIVEHVTTRDAVDFVAAAPANVAATVTVHHLLFTLDDLLGDCLRPHLFCKPVPKRPEDRAAIADAVFGGHPRFFFGSDSAPHPRNAKESVCGAAGVYTAPGALPLLAEAFVAAGVPLTEAEAGPSLESFCSRYGAEFYGLPLNEEQVGLEARDSAEAKPAGNVATGADGTEPHLHVPDFVTAAGYVVRYPVV